MWYWNFSIKSTLKFKSWRVCYKLQEWRLPGKLGTEEPQGKCWLKSISNQPCLIFPNLSAHFLSGVKITCQGKGKIILCILVPKRKQSKNHKGTKQSDKISSPSEMRRTKFLSQMCKFAPVLVPVEHTRKCDYSCIFSP